MNIWLMFVFGTCLEPNLECRFRFGPKTPGPEPNRTPASLASSVEICPELGFYLTIITGNPSFYFTYSYVPFSLGYLYWHSLSIFLLSYGLHSILFYIYSYSMFTLLSVVTTHLTESKCSYTYILLYFFYLFIILL